MLKHFYLNRDKTFSEVSIVTDTPYKRTINFIEGDNKDKKKNVHPIGVAWGTMYPKVFQAFEKPSNVFVHKGRAIAQTNLDMTNLAIPETYDFRFQPFTSDIIDSIHAKENIILTGGTGVGKTTHILQMASRIKQPVLRINFNGETRMSDLIGKISVVNGETVWVDGVLPMAMRKGYWLLLDELDFADPAVLSLLHPVLEENPMLVLKENSGEIIKPHNDFRVFATANSIGTMQDRAEAYEGTNRMNEAFLDRWQVIMVNNLPEKDEIRVVKSYTKGLPLATAKKIVAFANKVRKQEFSEIQFAGDNFSTRKVLAWAKKTALHRDALIGAKLAWLDKVSSSEQEVIVRILMTHFSRKKRSKAKLKITKTTAVKPKKVKPQFSMNGTNN